MCRRFVVAVLVVSPFWFVSVLNVAVWDVSPFWRVAVLDVSPFWLSPFWKCRRFLCVAVLVVAVLVCRRFDRYPQDLIRVSTDLECDSHLDRQPVQRLQIGVI